MKRKLLIKFSIFCLTLTLLSCQNELSNDSLLPLEEVVAESNVALIAIDTIDLGDASPLEQTDEQKAFLERMKQLKMKKRSTYGYGDTYDEYFWQNMWAIREMPFTLQARGGGNTGQRYLISYGKRQEIKTASNNGSYSQKFYVKIFSATTGIPYVLYSKQENTPLVVGHWSNDPNRKMLMPLDRDEITYNTSWDFVASSYKGYYAIENQSYLGQADPNNMWSVFNYVLDIKNNNVVGYSQYTKAASQEFLIKPDATFTLKKVEFVNPYSAKVTQRSNFDVVRGKKNDTPQLLRHNLEFTVYEPEESYFREKNTVAFNIYNSSLLFARPTVTLEKIDLIPDDGIALDTKYETNVSRKYDKKLSKIVPVTIRPRTQLIMTYSYKRYDVECDYIATITYGNDREAKIAGRWSGTILVDELFDPEFEEVDLNTNRSLRKKINIESASPSRPIVF